MILSWPTHSECIVLRHWISTSHYVMLRHWISTSHRIITWVLNVHVGAHLVSILIWLHEGLVLHLRVRWHRHLVLTALGFSEMESLLVNQLIFLFLILGEVLCDGALLSDDIVVSFISYYRCWSVHHGHLVFQFILRDLIVFGNILCVNILMHNSQLSCGRCSVTAEMSDAIEHCANNGKDSRDNTIDDFAR